MNKGHLMTLKALALALVVALLSVLPVQAQTALTTTTTAAAVTTPTATLSPTTSITLASTTGITANVSFIYIDRELMQVTSIANTPTVTVRRGAGSTIPSTHPINTLVYIGPASAFTTVDYTGTCTRTAQQYLPLINVSNGNIFDCTPSAQSGQAATTATAWKWVAWNSTPIMETKPRTVTTGAAYTILPTDYIVALITNGAVGTAVTVKSYTLPVPSTVTGKMLIIQDEAGIISATTSMVLVGTINGTSSLTATVIQMKTAFMSVGLYAGSDSWFVLWCNGGGVGALTAGVVQVSNCR